MNQRKLLLNERVEVRQFEEGLRGSWHPGVVVGVLELCRSVEYDELLSEKGCSKLIESIPVTEAIEGFHRRRHVPPTYRGRIRPPPPTSDTCGKLSFGVCVDALFEDAWWEGVIFDSNDNADERSVFFPDEDDEQKFNVKNLRITQDWDEFLGMWCDRGIWVLVQLIKGLGQDVPLCNYIKKVWSSLRLNYEFNKMISEWTCCVSTMWSKYFMVVVNEISMESSQNLYNGKIKTHVVGKSNKTKDSKRDKVTPGVSITSLQSGKCGALNIGRLSKNSRDKNSREKGYVECKQTKMALKSKLKSKHPVTDIIDKNNFQTNKLGSKKQMLDGDLTLTSNDTVAGDSDQISRVSTHMNEAVNSASLHTQVEQFGNVKSGIHKPRSNKPLADCIEQDKNITYDWSHVENDPAVRARKNLAKTGCSERTLAFSSTNRKQRKVEASPFIDDKQMKSSAKQFKHLRSKLRPLHKVKGKKGVLKQAKYPLSVTQRCPTLSFGNGKYVSLKDMVSRPRKRKRKRGYRGFQLTDTICSFCHCGGDLIHCNNCPSSYHLSCLDLKDAPKGRWFCPACCCGLCGSRNDNEQFTNPCLQCGRENHVCCLSKAGSSHSHYPTESFCSKACYKLCAQLQELLGISHPTCVKDLMWTLMRSGKYVYNFPGMQRVNSPIKLCHALRIMHECFNPVKEPHTRRDLVKDVVYNLGSKLRRLNFRGFYNLILHKGDEIVSVAAVRIHGLKAAEMPLVATPFEYRRQGMCRLLVHELSELLTQLGVERFILPSIPQLIKMWESSFGFLEMYHSERLELSGYPFLSFRGTVMLQKYLDRSTLIMKENFARISQDSEGKSSSAFLENICAPGRKTRYCGLFYKRKAKTKVTGKENLDDGCARNVHSYGRVYKRRRILPQRERSIVV